MWVGDKIQEAMGSQVHGRWQCSKCGRRIKQSGGGAVLGGIKNQGGHLRARDGLRPPSSQVLYVCVLGKSHGKLQEGPNPTPSWLPSCLAVQNVVWLPSWDGLTAGACGGLNALLCAAAHLRWYTDTMCALLTAPLAVCSTTMYLQHRRGHEMSGDQPAGMTGVVCPARAHCHAPDKHPMLPAQAAISVQLLTSHRIGPA